MRKKVLIVDDNKMNRILLRKMLESEYTVVEAADGEEAMRLLGADTADYSAVLLDLMMPVLDGYGVLKRMQKDPELRPIPVIVTTESTDANAEMQALQYGAHDFLMKPYNAPVLLQRLRNTIRFCETSELVNVLRWDELTGLYSRQGFFQRARQLIAEHEPGHYILACLNIDNFKVINDQYGNAMGDAVLRHVANALRTGIEGYGGVCCRVMADHFAVLYPRRLLGSRVLASRRSDADNVPGLSQPISLTTGRYLVDDLSLPVSAMYDRAAIAEDSIKGRVDVKVAQYDEAMRQQLLREQEIVNDMNAALAQGQFEVWYQPQYNHSTGALVGAEALVRWRHPTRGLISPGLFIPVFERNGFIFELDQYIWERVCANLRRWLDEGRTPLPVSVNASRFDVLREDFFDILTALPRKYDLPVSMLRVEITESAFAQDSARLIRVIKRLIDAGFTIEIDDFGSGYSSLNTLKDVPADILKLDMRFLEGADNMQRGGNILESIIRMAKWLGMPVIAEGVETREQADFLESIGCNYIQGYLYAKPMPVEEYEALAFGAGKEEKMIALVTVENLDNNAFWDTKSMDTLIFNSYVGGACIFEFHDGQVELLRANQRYADVLGGRRHLSIADALKTPLFEHISPEQHRALIAAMEEAVRTGSETVCDITFSRLAGYVGDTYLRGRMRVIARTGTRYLFYCTVEDQTAQHTAEQRAFETSERLQAIMENVGSGITALTFAGERVDQVFVNDTYFALLGYTRRQYIDEVRDFFDVVHPDDRELARRRAADVNWTGEPASIDYRARRRDGTQIWLRTIVSLTRFSGVEEPVQLGVTSDVTQEKQTEMTLLNASSQLEAILSNVHSGVSAATLVDGRIDYVFVNDEYFRMFGYTREQFEAELPRKLIDLIVPEDLPGVVASADECARTGRSTQIEFHVRTRDGSVRLVHSSSSACAVAGLDAPVHIAVLRDITRERADEKRLKQSAERIRALNEELTALMNDMPGGFARLLLRKKGTARVQYVNTGLPGMLGLTMEQLAARYRGDLYAGVHPADRTTLRGLVDDARNGHTLFHARCRLLHGDGAYRPFTIFGRFTQGDAGEQFLNLYYAAAPELTTA